MAAITADGRQELVALYLTMFGRAPTTVELAESVMAVEAGSTLAQVAATLSTKAEFALVASKDADSFALFLANSLLAADIPAAARAWAINWVVTQVTGTKSKAQVIAEAVQAIRATTNVNYATSKAELTADVTASLTVIDNPPVTGQSFTLTTSVDTGTLFTGSTGNDVFNAVDTNDPDTATYTSGDSLTGGGGTDTLRLVASGAGTGGIAVGALDVENVHVTNNSSATYVVDASLMTGLTTVSTTAGASQTTFDQVQNVVNVGMTSTQENVLVTAVAAAVAGTADAATVNISGVATSTSTTMTYNGIETFNVVSSGATSGSATTTLTLTSDKLSTVTVSGDKGANLVTAYTSASATEVAVFDASKATGAITASLDAGASTLLSVTGGAGNDSFSLVDALSDKVTMAGGNGTDTLTVTGAAYSSTSTTQVGGNVSGFEIISTSGTVDMRALSGTSSTVTEAVATAGATFSKVGTALNTVTATGAGTVTFDRSTDTAADTLTLKLNSQTGAATTYSFTSTTEDVLTINSGGKTGVSNTVTVTGEDLTSLTVTGDKSLDLGTIASAVSLATIDASGHTGPSFKADASVSNVAMTIKGSAGTPVAAADIVNTITGGSKGDSITGGAYKDSLTGGNGADTLDGGLGNDTLVGGSGADVLTGGDGNNSLSGGSGDDSLTAGSGNDTLSGGSGSDTLVAGAGNDVLVTASLTDDTNIDAGTGTDRLAAVDTLPAVTTLGVGTYVDVGDDAAPTIAGAETAYIQITPADGNTLETATTLDMSNVTGTTTLYLDLDSSADFAAVKNYGGSSVILTDTSAVNTLTLDGTGQAAVTVTLDAVAGGALTVTGIQALTLAARSKSLLTGTADQTSALGVVTANSVDSLTVSTSGSTAANAALTIASIDANAATSVTLSAATNDTLKITGALNTANDSVETLTVTAADSGFFDINTINLDGSDLDSATITLGQAAILSASGTGVAATADIIDVTASSITALTVTLGANADASLDLSGIEVTTGTFTINDGAVLNLQDSLGLAGTDSSFTFSGRGTLGFETGANTFANTLATLVGGTVSLNTTGMITDTGYTITTAASVKATITTAAGSDVITGGGGNDVISTGADADTLTGGAGNDTLTPGEGADASITGGTGGDSIVLTETSSLADTIYLANTQSVAYSAATVAGASFANGDVLTFANGVDTVTGFATGTDKLQVSTGATASLEGDAPTTLIGQLTADITEDLSYSARGTWSSTAKTFTLSATGADLIFTFNDGVAADDVASTNTNWIVFVGVTSLAAGDLI